MSRSPMLTLTMALHAAAAEKEPAAPTQSFMRFANEMTLRRSKKKRGQFHQRSFLSTPQRLGLRCGALCCGWSTVLLRRIAHGRGFTLAVRWFGSSTLRLCTDACHGIRFSIGFWTDMQKPNHSKLRDGVPSGLTQAVYEMADHTNSIAKQTGRLAAGVNPKNLWIPSERPISQLAS